MVQILIADDERKDRNIIRILLERRYAGRFRLWEAENGEQALEILRREAIQLLLLDINMPGLSGIDVLHSLETRPYIIMLTAYDHFVYTREALRCGVRDYLLKPPVREEFYQAVDRFLQTREPPVSQSRGVFARELARQLMYYGGREKIEGLLEVTGIRGGWLCAACFWSRKRRRTCRTRWRTFSTAVQRNTPPPPGTAGRRCFSSAGRRRKLPPLWNCWPG